MITMNGIEMADVARIGSLTAETFSRECMPREELALLAMETFGILETIYTSPELNTVRDFAQIGKKLHVESELIASQIAESGQLPTPTSRFDHRNTGLILTDDDILLMGVLSAIAMRGINQSSLRSEVAENMTKYWRLQGFAVASWDDLSVPKSVERMRSLVDDLIQDGKTLASGYGKVHPVSLEIGKILNGGDNVRKSIPVIEQYLIEKWDAGRLLVGCLPIQSGGNINFGVVLPE